MKKIVLLDLGGTISSYTQQSTAEFYSQKGVSLCNFINELNLSGKVEIHYEFFCNTISHEINTDNLIALGSKIQEIVDNPTVFAIVVSMGTNALETVLSGIPVVRCARSGLGITNIDVNYDNKYKFILASEFSPHKASILLSVCLAHELPNSEIQRVFEEY